MNVLPRGTDRGHESIHTFEDVSIFCTKFDCKGSFNLAFNSCIDD